jgi:hypothetical protein
MYERFSELNEVYAREKVSWQRRTTIGSAETFKTKKLNSVAWVRERTLPTERPPLVGKVSANFCG